MSFQAANLKSANPLGTGGSIWTYRTEDTDTDSSGYFPAGNFRIGDVIYVTVLTNMNLDTEAFASASVRVITTQTSPITTQAG